jgi:hypothetical protein
VLAKPFDVAAFGEAVAEAVAAPRRLRPAS